MHDSGGKSDDEVLMDLYPFIQWLEPIAVHRTDGVSRWACRICVAKGGLRAVDLERVGFDSRWEFDQHLRSAHAEVAV